jgi:hypothetical protein
MKIDTDEWVTLAEAVALLGIPQKTLYRIADRLELAATVFGVRVIRKSELGKLEGGRHAVGNPRWAESGDAASAAAEKATESRRARVAASGPTAAELRRNKRLAVIGATRGGRRAQPPGGTKRP